MKTVRLLSNIPAFWLFRRSGWPHRLPMNLTVSVTFRCNSRCRTCKVYEKESGELSLDEWMKVFRSLERKPFWVTVSGGEPFLRGDLAELVFALYDECRPRVINIPTNGLLVERIALLVGRMARHCAGSLLVVNVSIDDIGEKHDAIRGVPGNYARALAAFASLKALNLPNLSVGIHTVISRFNVKNIPEIYRRLRVLNPDSYVTEIAEERKELGTVGADIAPEYGDFAAAVDFLTRAMEAERFNRVGRVTRAFRTEYYRMVKKILSDQRQVIPCYAGFASAHIAPDGDVWTCCLKAEPVGNLKRANYEFGKVWFSKEAERLRDVIKKERCCCPLANASYTNMLHNLKALSSVGWNYVTQSLP